MESTLFCFGKQPYEQIRACGDSLFSSSEINSACESQTENASFPTPFRSFGIGNQQYLCYNVVRQNFVIIKR